MDNAARKTKKAGAKPPTVHKQTLVTAFFTEIVAFFGKLFYNGSRKKQGGCYEQAIFIRGFLYPRRKGARLLRCAFRIGLYLFHRREGGET